MIDASQLDHIIEKTISTVEQSKEQIFDIAEEARLECENLRKEVEKLNQEIQLMIEKNNKLEVELRISRQRLSNVSRNFKNFSELDVRKAYELANSLQVKSTLELEKEKQLRSRRDDIHQRLKNLDQTIQKADTVLSQISVVFEYLTGEIKEVGQVIEDAKYRQLMGLQMIQAQEEERKRLAREIHDGPAQSMANVVLRTELIERVFLQEGVNKAKSEIKNLKEIVRESLGDVRRIIFDLRPMALDDLGLVPTLTRYLEKMKDTHGLAINFVVIGHATRLPSLMEVALFRLVQEALNNVIRHAEADLAEVKIEFNSQYVLLLIRDEGKGFIVEERSRAGFGLMGMKERVKLLEGKWNITSKREQGTKIYIKIPLNLE